MNRYDKEKFLYDFCTEVWSFLQTREGKKVLNASGGIMSAVEPNTKVLVHFSETNASWESSLLRRFLRETVILREIEELQQEFNDLTILDIFELAAA